MSVEEQIDRARRKLEEAIARRPKADSVREREAALLTGAIFSLVQAHRLRYSREDALDRSNTDTIAEMRSVLRDLGASLNSLVGEFDESGRDNLRRWVAGYYFVSAVLRLHAANARLGVDDVRVRRIADYADWAKHGDSVRNPDSARDSLPDLSEAADALALVVDAHCRERERG